MFQVHIKVKTRRNLEQHQILFFVNFVNNFGILKVFKKGNMVRASTF